MTSAEADDDSNQGGVTPVTDIVAGAVLMALAVVALFWIVPAYTETGVSGYDVSPAFFPRLGAGVVLALACVLIAAAARRHLANDRDGASGRLVLVDVLIWSAAAVGTVVGLQYIGFVATSVIVIAGWMLLAGQRRWLTIAAAAMLFPLAVDQAAWFFFTVDLP